MLIECTIRRDGGTIVNLYGKTYFFRPNAEGAHVCEVEDEDAIDRFLSIPEGYRLARKGASMPKRAEPVNAAAPNRKKQLPVGAAPNLEAMTRDELIEYAVNLGMRKPHPSIKDNRLRQNIALWLAERLEGLVPAPIEEEGDGAGEDDGGDE